MIQNRLVIRPDKVVEFIEALKNHMKWTLGNEPGCRKINVVSDANDRNKFHLYKLYEDENALIKHAQSLTPAELRIQFPEWLVQQERFTGDLIFDLANIQTCQITQTIAVNDHIGLN